MNFMSEKTFSLDHKHWVEGLYRGREMAQHLRALAAPAEESNSDPSTHIWQRKTACNSSSRGLSALFKLLWKEGMNMVQSVHVGKHLYT